jgi:hypothetical protein
MKTTTSILALALLTATAIGVHAADKTSNPKQTKGLVKREKTLPNPALHEEKNVLLTGSYIKRNVRRQGLVTDGPNALYLLDQRTIDLSGAADLSQVLIRSGFHR